MAERRSEHRNVIGLKEGGGSTSHMSHNGRGGGGKEGKGVQEQQCTEKERQLQEELQREKNLMRMLLEDERRQQQYQVVSGDAGMWNDGIGAYSRGNVGGMVLPEQPLQPVFFQPINLRSSALVPAYIGEQHTQHMGTTLPNPHRFFPPAPYAPQVVYARQPQSQPQPQPQSQPQPQPQPQQISLSYTAQPNVVYHQCRHLEQQRLQFVNQHQHQHHHQERPHVYTAQQQQHLQYTVSTTVPAMDSRGGGTFMRNDSTLRMTNKRSGEDVYNTEELANTMKTGGGVGVPSAQPAKKQRQPSCDDVQKKMATTIPPVVVMRASETLPTEMSSAVAQAVGAAGGPSAVFPPEVLNPTTFRKTDEFAARVHVALKEWQNANGPERECSFEELFSNICFRMGVHFCESQTNMYDVIGHIQMCLLVMIGLGLIKRTTGDNVVVVSSVR